LRYWLVVPAAGTGQRFGADRPKQYLQIAGRSLLEWSVSEFARDPRCAGVVLALAPGDPYWPAIRSRLELRVIEAPGGAQRCDSVRNALATLQPLAAAGDWVLVHDAARPCVTRGEIDALVAAAQDHPCGGLLAAPLADTLKRQGAVAPANARPAVAGSGGVPAVAATVPREGLWRALTPQMFRLEALLAALEQAAVGQRMPTDEAQAMEWAGGAPLLVPGALSNVKVTTASDLGLAQAILFARLPQMRIGSGIDIHAFGPGDHVMLGGVRIDHTQGVVAHSDGDVVLHALCDALLGAAALGDIGQHFPDSDPRWRSAASSRFVEAAMEMLAERGLRVVNADITLLAQAPRIGPHRAAIAARVAQLLALSADAVNIKATTTEGLGFVGRTEGLVAQATVLVGPA
jgi:2-C-methyl-D-erythritol 4-phosphate cytidylyltransferase / 2-C-methyl-D-erythritol 2,4-cyclodiphosphate synthase